MGIERGGSFRMAVQKKEGLYGFSSGKVCVEAVVKWGLT